MQLSYIHNKATKAVSSHCFARQNWRPRRWAKMGAMRIVDVLIYSKDHAGAGSVKLTLRQKYALVIEKFGNSER